MFTEMVEYEGEAEVPVDFDAICGHPCMSLAGRRPRLAYKPRGATEKVAYAYAGDGMNRVLPHNEDSGDVGRDDVPGVSSLRRQRVLVRLRRVLCSSDTH